MEELLPVPPVFFADVAYAICRMDFAMQISDPAERNRRSSDTLARFFPKPALDTSIWSLIVDEQAQSDFDRNLLLKFGQSLSRMARVFFEDPVYTFPDFQTDFLNALRPDPNINQIHQLLAAYNAALATLNRLPFDVVTSLADLDLFSDPAHPQGEGIWRITRIYRLRRTTENIGHLLKYLDFCRGAKARFADIRRAEYEVRTAKLAAELKLYNQVLVWITNFGEVDTFDEVEKSIRRLGPWANMNKFYGRMARIQAMQDATPSAEFLELVPSAQPQPTGLHHAETAIECFVCLEPVVVGVEFCRTCVNNFCHYHCWRRAAWEAVRGAEHLTEDTEIPCSVCKAVTPLGSHRIVIRIPKQREPPSKRQRVDVKPQ